MRLKTLRALSGFVLVAGLGLAGEPRPAVRITHGSICGTAVDGVLSFKGIPFGQAECAKKADVEGVGLRTGRSADLARCRRSVAPLCVAPMCQLEVWHP